MVINSRLVVARCPVLIPAGTTAILMFSLVTLFLLHELQLVPRLDYDRFLTNTFHFVVSSHPATDAISPDILTASYNRLQNHSHLVVSLKNAVRNCGKQYFELETPNPDAMSDHDMRRQIWIYVYSTYFLTSSLLKCATQRDSGTPQCKTAPRSPELYVRRCGPDYKGIRTTEGKSVVEVTFATLRSVLR
jgi:hypothetical protein